MKTTLTALAVALALLPAVAQAQDSPLSANVSLTSKYKYRGQDQSNEEKNILPAIQGGFDYAAGGFYIGNWNSSIGFANGTESDIYLGYSGEVEGFSYDVGLLQYMYPGESELNTTELYASVGFGPVTAKYSATVSKKYFGIEAARKTGYLEVTASFDLAEGITLSGTVGTTQFSSSAKSNGAVNYTDYKVAVDFDLGSGFSAGVAYVGANKKGVYGDLNKARLIATLSKSL